uniref:Putative secreted protein n=1 Tax=Anopheles marajoara TaxID=58244 RepID=A0A2M4CD54_9DIPT
MFAMTSLCLYLLRLSRDFAISSASSVSSLNDTTYACGTQRLTNGASIFGTNCNDIVGAPCPDWILCVGISSCGT